VNCTGPRIRKNWASLSLCEQCRIANLLVRIKQYQDSWKTGSSNKTSLYNVFVEMHSNPLNSAQWHGTSFFLPAHKYFLWVLESALIWIAKTDGPIMRPPLSPEDACNIALPYWAWEMDFDYDLSDNIDSLSLSELWHDRIIGSYKPGAVNDGQFTSKRWTTVLQTSNDPLAIYVPPVDNVLKRYLDTTAIPLLYDPSQLINEIVSRPQFADFTKWIEAGPHSIPHLLFGFHMSTMYSVDDPVFFLHHCNIDRLWHIWMDCHDYEKLSADELTDVQYTALNPVNGNNPKVDPDTQQPFLVGLHDKISYYWQSKDYSIIFPSEKWPTPADLWGLGTENSTGWDGLYYRYGPDELVMSKPMLENCAGKDWSWVNYVETEQQHFAPILPNLTRISAWVESINDNYTIKLDEGMDIKQALTKLAQEACEAIPTLEMTDYVREWFEMVGLNPDEGFIRVCDIEAESMHGAKWLTGLQSRKKLKAIVGMVKDKWPIIISGSVIAVILVVVVIIFILKKNREKFNTINH